MQISDFTKLVPIRVSPSGKTKTRLLRLLEALFPKKIEEGYQLGNTGITLSEKNEFEKLLYYFFFNVLRYFKKTDLYQYLKQNKGDNKIFVDIGANIGIYSYLARQLGYTVIAFEPEPRHAEFLKRNPAIYDKFFEIALSDEAGQETFYVGDEHNLDANSIVMTDSGWKESPYEYSIEVETRRLDQICKKEPLIQVADVIKVDVEGFEKYVIQGMKELLEQEDVYFDIWCEVRGETSDRNAGSYKKVSAFLQEAGYTAYVYKDGRRIAFNPEKHVDRVFDLLFVQEAD